MNDENIQKELICNENKKGESNLGSDALGYVDASALVEFNEHLLFLSNMLTDLSKYLDGRINTLSNTWKDKRGEDFMQTMKEKTDQMNNLANEFKNQSDDLLCTIQLVNEMERVYF